MPGPAAPLVWVSRTAPGADRTARAVEALGYRSLQSPLLVANPDFARPVGDLELDQVSALAFTSDKGLVFADWTPRRDWPVFCVGDYTAQAARGRGFTDVRSAGGDARDLAALIRCDWPALEARGHLLVPTAVQPAADLSVMLKGEVPVRLIAVYETSESPAPLPEGFDVVLLHSPRAARALARRLLAEAAQGRIAVALSEAVAAPLRPLGFREIRVAAHPDETSLLEALGKPQTTV
jgi:uroporphyrinogen-III synthase